MSKLTLSPIVFLISWMIAYVIVNQDFNLGMALEYFVLLITGNAFVRPAFTLFISIPVFFTLLFMMPWLISSGSRYVKWCLTGHTSIIIPPGLQIVVANDLIKVGSELIVDDSVDLNAGEGLFALHVNATRFPKGTRLRVCGIGRERFIVEPIKLV